VIESHTSFEVFTDGWRRFYAPDDKFTLPAGFGCDSGRLCGGSGKLRVVVGRLCWNSGYVRGWQATPLAGARPLVPCEGQGSVCRAFECVLQIARVAVIVRGNADVTILEPPYTDPYVRWCGRGRQVTAAPMPISRATLPTAGGRRNPRSGRVADNPLASFNRQAGRPPPGRGYRALARQNRGSAATHSFAGKLNEGRTTKTVEAGIEAARRSACFRVRAGKKMRIFRRLLEKPCRRRTAGLWTGF
jgi:hypothetical protein